MKSYTDLEQSKKLAEILPIESADIRYHTVSHYNPYLCDEIIYTMDFGRVSGKDIPCWSLTALLNVLPKSLIYTPNPTLDGYCCKNIMHDLETYSDNPIDTCVAMIEKLHELNLL